MFSKKENNVESELKLDLLSNYETVTKTLNNAISAFKLITEYLGPNKSKTYDLRLWLDENVTTETVNIQNTTFNSKVVVTASYVKEMPFATNVISKLAKDADSSSTDVYTVPNKTSDTCTYTLAYDGTSDNNLRYVGENPCNYVKVDDEYWRIIGVMNNIDDGTGKKESRIKLIRDESIGNYSWDTSDTNSGDGVNEWSQADLMKLLNPGYESESYGGSLYYNSKSGWCWSAPGKGRSACDFTSKGLKSNLKSLIGNVLWNTGSNGENNWDSTTNGLVNHFYSYERSNNTGKVCSSGNYCTDTITRKTVWQGKVGLMYPSDYGYATVGNSSTSRSTCLSTALQSWKGDCSNTDWLSNSTQWTMTPNGDSSKACNAYLIGSSVSSLFGGMSYNVRPSVYILSKATILNGEGTKEEPYELSL